MQLLYRMVLQMAGLLVHALHYEGVGLLMWRLEKLRAKLLPIYGVLLRLSSLLLLEHC